MKLKQVTAAPTRYSTDSSSMITCTRRVSNEPTQRYFFEAIGATLYLFVQLQFWDESLFEASVTSFCECIAMFGQQLISHMLLHPSVTALTTNHPVSGTQLSSLSSSELSSGLDSSGKLTHHESPKDSIENNLTNQNESYATPFLVAGLNEMHRLDRHLLRRQTLEMLTDHPSDQVWSAFFQLETNDPTKKTPSKDGTLMRLCNKVDQVAKRLQQTVSPVISLLGTALLRAHDQQLKVALEAPPLSSNGSTPSSSTTMFSRPATPLSSAPVSAAGVAPLLTAVDQLQNALKGSACALKSKSHAARLLLYIKQQLDKYVSRQTDYLVSLLQDEESQVVARRHLTRIQLIRLATTAHKHKKLLLSFMIDLKLDPNSLGLFFVDTDHFDQALQPLLEST